MPCHRRRISGVRCQQLNVKLSLFNDLADGADARSVARLRRDDLRVAMGRHGVFDLASQATEHPEWASRVEEEIAEIRSAIQSAERRPLKYVIWAGMGGSVEDKLVYEGAGLLRKGPRFYALDSTDPAKLIAILADIRRRSGGSLGRRPCVPRSSSAWRSA